MAPYLTTLTPLAVLLATVLWVHHDASAHSRRGTPVSFSVGSMEVATPATWALGCLCLWILFMPLYLTCRRRTR
jgi:hypothetical protein